MSSFGTDENPKFYFFKKNPKFLHEPACSANPKADKMMAMLALHYYCTITVEVAVPPLSFVLRDAAM